MKPVRNILLNSFKSSPWLLLFFLFFSLFFLGTRYNLDGYELEYVLSAMNIYHGGGPELAPGYHDLPGIKDTNLDRPVYPRQNFLQAYLSVPFYPP